MNAIEGIWGCERVQKGLVTEKSALKEQRNTALQQESSAD